MDTQFVLSEGLLVLHDDSTVDHLRVGPPVANLELPSTSGDHVQLLSFCFFILQIIQCS